MDVEETEHGRTRPLPTLQVRNLFQPGRFSY